MKTTNSLNFPSDALFEENANAKELQEGRSMTALALDTFFSLENRFDVVRVDQEVTNISKEPGPYNYEIKGKIFVSLDAKKLEDVTVLVSKDSLYKMDSFNFGVSGDYESSKSGILYKSRIKLNRGWEDVSNFLEEKPCYYEGYLGAKRAGIILSSKLENTAALNILELNFVDPKFIKKAQSDNWRWYGISLDEIHLESKPKILNLYKEDK